MSENCFKKLDEAFNIESKEEEIELTVQKMNELKKTIEGQKYTLEDKEYMKTELQSLISINRQVLDDLASTCKIGAPPRMFEVFASLSNTISTNIMNLMKLEETVTNYKVTEEKEKIALDALDRKERIAQAKIASQSGPNNLTQINNTYNFTSKELLEMVKKAKTESDERNAEIIPEFNLD